LDENRTINLSIFPDLVIGKVMAHALGPSSPALRFDVIAGLTAAADVETHPPHQ